MIPSSAALTIPLLEELGDGREHVTRELWERLCVKLELSAAEISEKTEKGKFRFYSRVGWARTQLRTHELIVYTGTSRCRITDAGTALLKARQAEALVGSDQAGPPVLTAEPAPAIEISVSPVGALEAELRAAMGPAARSDADWLAICLLNGWSASGVHTYPEVAKITGRPTDELLSVARRCKHKEGRPAPILDAALTIASAHPDVSPEELSMILAGYDLVASTFSIAGLAEGARRFGRAVEWERLVRYLAQAHRQNKHKFVRPPRPFESWFEVDVFIVLRDTGLEVTPQVYVSGYRADLVILGANPKVIVECDGEKWHQGERADGDRAREHVLVEGGYCVVRVSGMQWHKDAKRAAKILLETLEMMNVIQSAIA